MTTRKPVFAGSWYPADRSACLDQIQGFLSDKDKVPPAGGTTVGGIVPHAGWYFSGRIACQVIDRLASVDTIDLVLLFGMHLHAGSAAYMMPDGAWQTPLGDLEVASDLARHLMLRYRFELETADDFVQDNTVELQLPFIRHLLNPKAFLAIGVPPVGKSLEIGRDAVQWAQQNGLRIRVIGSTDLTHYGRNYGLTVHGTGDRALNWVRDENDRRMVEAMLAMDPQTVIREASSHQNACCAGAAATGIAAAKQLGAAGAQLLTYATSYDKHPDESFVGYAGVVFNRP